MSKRKTLTKSLHTVSAVSRVAVHLAGISAGKPDPVVMVHSALQLLGHPGPWPEDDPTVAMAIKQTTKALGTKVLRHSDGWRIELDRGEVIPDDPGAGTPAVVHALGGYSATYYAACQWGEVTHERSGAPMEVPHDVHAWLLSKEEEIEAFLRGE